MAGNYCSKLNSKFIGYAEEEINKILGRKIVNSFLSISLKVILGA